MIFHESPNPFQPSPLVSCRQPLRLEYPNERQGLKGSLPPRRTQPPLPFSGGFAAPSVWPIDSSTESNPLDHQRGRLMSPPAGRPYRPRTAQSAPKLGQTSRQHRRTSRILDCSGCDTWKASSPMNCMSAYAAESGCSRAFSAQLAQDTRGNSIFPGRHLGEWLSSRTQRRKRRTSLAFGSRALLWSCPRISHGLSVCNTNKQAGVVLNGLTKRRAAESAIYRGEP